MSGRTTNEEHGGESLHLGSLGAASRVAPPSCEAGASEATQVDLLKTLHVVRSALEDYGLTCTEEELAKAGSASASG